MTRRSKLLGGALALAATIFGCRPASEAPTARDGESAERAAAAQTVTLLFPGPGGEEGGLLEGEPRELTLAGEPAARVRTILEALFAGPSREPLQRPFPDSVTVGKVFVDAEGVAFVDLASPDPMPPPSGSRVELLRVYSLVDTLLLNDPELKSVVLLWNGQQLDTFAGHVDTGHALLADRDLIAPTEQASR